MENGEVTSVLEYIDFLHAILGRLSLEEIDYSDYCQMTDYLDEIEKRVKQLEKKQEPMKPLSSYGEYTCPMCELNVAKYDGYCWKCGQKLDWEDQMNELRLCPYCYGEARILPEGDYHEVTCEVCGVYVQGHTYEDAVNAWNCNAEIYDNTED